MSDRFFSKNWLFLLIAVFLIGLFFRCVNLDRKIFWVDEVATATRISGYTRPEITQELTDGGILEVKDLLRYQKLTPEKDLGDTLNALTKSPEHAPLYFLIARFWRQLFGSSIAATRSLSVVFSLLAFPCLYWLCLELFKSPLVGYIAIALFSVSPFYVAYAQEARPYSLWIVTILLSGTAILRAIRLNNRQSWLFYIFSLLLGFYTSLLTFLIALGHGIYAIAIQKFRFTKVIKNYCISISLTAFFFIPWLFVIFNNWLALKENTDWIDQPVEISFTIAIFVASILLIFGNFPLPSPFNLLKVVEDLFFVVTIILIIYFFYINLSHYLKNKTWFYGLLFSILFISLIILLIKPENLAFLNALNPISTLGIVVALGLLPLTVISIFFALTTASKKLNLFLFTQTFTTPLFLVANDIIFQDQSSGAPRYLIAFQLGILLSVAYFIASKLQVAFPLKLRALQRWKTILIALISVGIISGILNINTSPIYQKSRNFHNLAIAKLLNQAKEPSLLVETQQTMDILSLGNNLDSQVKIQIFSNLEKLSFAILNCQKSETFIFNPSLSLREGLAREKRIKLEQVYKPNLLIPTETVLSLWLAKTSENNCNSLEKSHNL
jgi:uncharacterized membrane protein